MRCEVCGRRIHGTPNRVVIEGAKMTACNECAKLGTGTWELPKPVAPPVKITGTKPTQPAPVRKTLQPIVDSDLELVEDFDTTIRQAREKLGVSHENLAKKLNLKVSFLRKIETGKMKPNNKVASVLEHALKIKLMVPPKEEKAPHAKLSKTANRTVTFGDLINLDKKGEEKGDMPGRGQS